MGHDPDARPELLLQPYPFFVWNEAATVREVQYICPQPISQATFAAGIDAAFLDVGNVRSRTILLLVVPQGNACWHLTSRDVQRQPCLVIFQSVGLFSS